MTCKNRRFSIILKRTSDIWAMKNMRTRCINVILVIMCILIIAPIITYSAYSFPVADDYSNSKYNFVEAEGASNSLFVPALKKTINDYHNSGGGFWAKFVNFYTSPLLRGGVSGIRIANSVMCICFFLILWLYCYSFNTLWLGKTSSYSLTMFLIIIFCLNNIGEESSAIYTSHINIAAYVFSLSVMMFSHVILFWSVNKDNKAYLLSGVIGFLASGTPLNVAALNCTLLLIAILLSYALYKRLRETIFVFTVSFLGALINACAPGNFNRRAVMHHNTEYNILQSITDTVVFTFGELEHKLTETVLAVIIIGVLFLILTGKDGMRTTLSFNYPILAALVGFVGVCIVNFPVILGSGSVQDRGLYVQDLASYILIYLWILYFCGWIKSKSRKLGISRLSFRGLYSISIVIAALPIVVHCSVGYTNVSTRYMIRSIVNGDLIRYVKFEEGIINEVIESDQSDVVIYRDEEITNPYFERIGQDRSKYTNSAFGGYYDKNVIIRYGIVKDY